MDFANVQEFSVAIPATVEAPIAGHLTQEVGQEDLCFVYWRPVRGSKRLTALIYSSDLPDENERILHGNVAFTSDYLRRSLATVPDGSGVGFIHNHWGPGWQGMSTDDVVAERERLAGAVFGRTGLPLVGMTRASDGAWSARFWMRTGRNEYERRSATNVRVVGRHLNTTFDPELVPPPSVRPSQVATASVWGTEAQDDLVRTHVGIVGLGSVGSIVAEALGRVGLRRITLIDHDVIEPRNLDRTLNASETDGVLGTPKVTVAARALFAHHTADELDVIPVAGSVIRDLGRRAALDCDALISCVDRPWPRHLLNALAYSCLIPVIDGGILARVNEEGLPLHVDWRIHTVGPGQACLFCIGALRRSDVALDMEGKLDDPDYLAGLSPAERQQYERRNVFAFSLSVAAHQVLQLVGLIGGMERVGGIGPQHYSAYPGRMDVEAADRCDQDCEIAALLASGDNAAPQ